MIYTIYEQPVLEKLASENSMQLNKDIQTKDQKKIFLTDASASSNAAGYQPDGKEASYTFHHTRYISFNCSIFSPVNPSAYVNASLIEPYLCMNASKNTSV